MARVTLVPIAAVAHAERLEARRALRPAAAGAVDVVAARRGSDEPDDLRTTNVARALHTIVAQWTAARRGVAPLCARSMDPHASRSSPPAPPPFTAARDRHLLLVARPAWSEAERVRRRRVRIGAAPHGERARDRPLELGVRQRGTGVVFPLPHRHRVGGDVAAPARLRNLSEEIVLVLVPVRRHVPADGFPRRGAEQAMSERARDITTTGRRAVALSRAIVATQARTRWRHASSDDEEEVAATGKKGVWW